MSRVRAVLSGDTLLLKTKDNKEHQLTLAYVQAPRVSEPQGFKSREYLRIFSVGKPVRTSTLYESNGRVFGDVQSPVFASLIEHMLRLGLVELRKDASSKPGYQPHSGLFEEAQDFAKNKELGIWSQKQQRLSVRADLPDSLYGSGRKVPAIVERVISGDRVVLRAMMDEDDHFLGHVLLAGVRARRSNAGDAVGDAAAEVLASRLLQRQDLRAVFHAPSATADGLPLVTLVHPQGDAAHLLVSSGLAEASNTPQIGSERLLLLKNAQKDAEAKGVGMFREAREAKERHREKYAASTHESVVVRVISGDLLVLNNMETVQLASVRAPPRSEDQNLADSAREFVRKLLIGKPVRVQVDGESRGENPRKLVTLSFGHQFSRNPGLEIIQAGWATAMRHRRDDLARSPFYDELVQAETEAKESKRGLWGPEKKKPVLVDASESIVRARGYLAALERKPRVPAVIEHVLSAGRLRVSIPSERCTGVAVLTGVKTPRNSEPGAEEALKYVFTEWNQRDVQLTITGVDKTGAFSAQVFQNQRSLNLDLVANGLGSVHGSANGDLRKLLDEAEADAQTERLGIWKDYTEPEPVVEVVVNSTETAAEDTAKEAAIQAVLASVQPEQVHIRTSENDVAYKRIKSELQSFFSASTNETARAFKQKPKSGSFVLTPEFERAQVESVDRATNKLVIKELDTGISGEYSAEELLPVPEQFVKQPALAKPVQLRFVQKPMKDYEQDYLEFLAKYVAKPVHVRSGLLFENAGDTLENSVNMKLVEGAYASVPQRHARFDNAELFLAAQDRVKDEHQGMWEYGDPRDDEDM